MLFRSMDKFAHLSYDIRAGTDRFNQDYTILRTTVTQILNTFHAFIYTVPHTEKSNHKFHIGMSELQTLLNKETDDVHRIVSSRNASDININTIFHYKNHPASHVRRNSSLDRYEFICSH